MGGNVGEVFGRLKEGVEKIEEKIPFSSTERLGKQNVYIFFYEFQLALSQKENGIFSSFLRF